MSNQPPTSLALTRRTFLKRAATLGAMLVIPGAAVTTYSALQHASVQSAQLPQVFRVGIVLPHSQIAPNLAERLYQGFQLAFDLRGTTEVPQIELIPRHYGMPTMALQHARELVAQHQVDLVSGLFSRNHTASLAATLDQFNVPLIVSDIGANVISAANTHPLIARSSLGYWQAAFALGSWAAGQLGTRAAIATSFYESGYDTIHAFRAGFEQAGGQILATIVSDSPQRKQSHPAQALTEIAALQPDLVFAAYSGNDAVGFVRAYADSGLQRRVPLLGGSMLVDELFLAEAEHAALGIRSAAAWSPALVNPHNQAFMAAYALRTGQQADAIALLGYDTAQLIGAIADASPDHAAYGSALQFAAVTSPRGPLTLSSSYLESTSPIYLRETRLVGGILQHSVIEELALPTAVDSAVMALRTQQRSGWTNAYLCV